MSLILTLGQLFRTARVQHGCSAATVGNLINVTQSDWLAFELGMSSREKFSVDQLERAAKFLNLMIPQSAVESIWGQS
jgi:transcriptional regulator with XRE-family HTH domain